MRKERIMQKYNYDHIIKLLLEKQGWIRVPYWIPGVNTPRLEGIVL